MRKLLAAVVLVGLATCGVARAQREEPRWPTLREQMVKAKVEHGTALEQLITENQDFSMLDRREANDKLRIPLWLRVNWRKAHPELTYSAKDPTHGYPLVLKEVAEWMMTHPNFDNSRIEQDFDTKTLATGANVRLSGAQSVPRSESDIRVNYWNPSKIIGASNNIGGTGQQAQWYSSDGGASWSQTNLPLATGDSFHSDPTVDWTSDGTAWSTTIGINSAGTVLKMRAYRSTNGGATWTLDGTFSGSQTSADKQMMWVDHSATSAFKDTIYAIWHNGNPAYVSRRTGGAWSAPVQVSGSETTGTAIGADVKTNSAGDVFAMWPDTGSRKIYLVKSTNGGSSWSARTTVATTYDSYDIGVPSFNGRRMLVYVAVGAYRTGTKNNVYAVWNDLSGDTGCTTASNEPGSSTTSACKTRIWFARSTDGGTTWGAKVKINNQAGKNDQFNPWLVVDETNGKIAVMYYDTVNDAGRKKVDVYYQSSSDDGSTWTTPLKVTTAMTDETISGADSGNQFGDYNSLSGISGGFFPSWTDRRSGGREEIWSAKVTDDGGAVNNPPAANFTFGTSGLTANFTDTSTDSDGTIASRAWNFGDGGTSTATNPSHAYASAGTYTVSLTVTDNLGATGNTSKPVTVSATCTPPAAPTGVSASATSPTATSVSWSASSGATSYTVSRATTSGGPYSAVGTVSASPFANSGLTCNTTYYYVVSASNGSCSSGNSAQAAVTTQACPTGDTPLTNNVAITISDPVVNHQTFYYIDVPAGQSSLVVTLSGGTGDADIYTQFNAKPTTSSYLCRPYVSGNNETCTHSSPAAGRWWIMVNAYSAYSGASLKAAYTAAAGCTTYTGSISTVKGSSYVPTTSGYVSSVSGTHTGVLTGPAGTDFDLYLQKLSGSTWTNVKSGTTSSPNENVSYSGTSGTYRWRVYAYSGTGSYSICIAHP